MSNSASRTQLEFRCPVCRAKQTRQSECRRCHADLTLVVQGHRRTEHLLTAYRQAEQQGDARKQTQIRDELKCLAPGILRKG